MYVPPKRASPASVAHLGVTHGSECRNAAQLLPAAATTAVAVPLNRVGEGAQRVARATISEQRSRRIRDAALRRRSRAIRCAMPHRGKQRRCKTTQTT